MTNPPIFRLDGAEYEAAPFFKIEHLRKLSKLKNGYPEIHPGFNREKLPSKPSTTL